jgi:hypothetical protein
MGFFSFITTNTGMSIANIHSPQYTIPVVMVLPDGTMYKEEAYEGYGVFGGKDFFHAVAEINGEDATAIGVDMYHEPEKYRGKDLKFPQLLEIIDGEFNLEDLDFSKRPKYCEFQGYFY